MAITKFLDPAQMPARTQDQQTFDNLMAAFMQLLPSWGAEANALAANLNSIAAGGAYAIPFKFDTGLTQLADPGSGKMRLDNANVNIATSLTVSTASAGGNAVNGYVQSAVISTSAVKATVKISSLDGTRYAVYDITSISSGTGYNTLSLTFRSTPGAASPFISGETLMLFFDRIGDKGDTGNASMVLLGSTVVSSAVAAVNYLTIYGSGYDKYIIDLQNVRSTQSTGDTLNFQLAKAGAIDAAAVYGYATGSGVNVVNTATSSLALTLTTFTGSLIVKDANGTYYKPMDLRGVGYSGSASNQINAVDVPGVYEAVNAVTGFRLYFTAGSIASGTVRVYGVKNT
jgi:hypothetical protein